MNILLELITGMGLGIEFPGGGLNCVLTLLVVRIYFMNNETLEEWTKDE